MIVRNSWMIGGFFGLLRKQAGKGLFFVFINSLGIVFVFSMNAGRGSLKNNAICGKD